MPRFYIDFDGATQDEGGQDFPDSEAARNAAVERLGVYLQDHPEFAYSRHWRVDVRDSARRLVLHVIVSTVQAPPPINFASYES
jgi:hypothetical protein